jgi:hypothetical protein
VANCPTTGQPLQCSNSSNCTGLTSSYDTQGIINGLGGLCEPTSPSVQASFYADSQINAKMSSINMYYISLISLAISALVGLIYMIVFILLPRALTYAVFVLAGLTLLAAGILLIVQPVKLLAFSGNAWNIVLGILFILLAIVLVVFLFCQRQEIELGAIFLVYSNNFLKDKFVLFFYIPLFVVCSFALVVLCIWQFVAIGSANTPTWTPAQLYRHIQDNVFLLVLNIIEFIWGIQFIRDACSSSPTKSTTSSLATPSSGTSRTTTETPPPVDAPSFASSAGTSAASSGAPSSTPSSTSSASS